MSQKTRKFIGLVILLSLLTIYVAGAITIAPLIIPAGTQVMEILYYVIAGGLWVWPASYVIAWMQKP